MVALVETLELGSFIRISQLLSMAPRIHAAIIATVILLVVGQSSNAVPTESEVFWRTVLPDSPLPDAVLKLLHPENSFVNKPKDDTDAEGFSQTRLIIYSPRHPSPNPSVEDITRLIIYSPRHPSPKPSVDDISRLIIYNPTKHSTPRTPRDRDHNTEDYLAQGFFFHEEAVQLGKNITLYFPSAASAPLGLLPRHVADSIPFSTSSLPAALAQLGIARNSVEAASMEETLDMCEMPPVAGEAKFCAASLEALVEGSIVALGTRNIRPVTSDLPRSGAPKQPYIIQSVRPVDGSSFLSCHNSDYPYTVYMCHDTGSTRVYMVEMEGAHSGVVVTVAAICHTDTSHWHPEHVAFKILGTKPGNAPICHYLGYGHIVWVNREANHLSS